MDHAGAAFDRCAHRLSNSSTSTKSNRGRRQIGATAARGLDIDCRCRTGKHRRLHQCTRIRCATLDSDRDKALLENANIDLSRYQIAYSKNAIPKQQLDTQLATVHQYEGIVKIDQGQI